MVGHDFTIPDTSAAIKLCRETAASFYGVGKAFEEGARIYADAICVMQASMPQPTPLQQKMLRQKWDASRRRK